MLLLLIDLTLGLILLILALILFLIFAAIITATVLFVKYWIEEIQDNKEGFVHKLIEKLEDM